MYYKIQIDETGRNSLKDKSTFFNSLVKKVKSLEDVKAFLIDHYGKMPGKKNKIYVDRNGKREVIGFMHSFWNQDISHMTPKWYQTDWVTVTEVEEKPVLSF